MWKENNNELIMHRNEDFQSSCGKNLDLCGGKLFLVKFLEKKQWLMWKKSRHSKWIMANWVGGALWCFPKNYSEWALLDKYENRDTRGLSYIVCIVFVAIIVRLSIKTRTCGTTGNNEQPFTHFQCKGCLHKWCVEHFHPPFVAI